MPTKVLPEHSRKVLEEILTVSEVSRMWGISPETVRLDFNLGKIAGRQSARGDVILIHAPSVQSYRGRPKHLIKLHD